MLRVFTASALLICGVGLANSCRSQELLPGGPPLPFAPMEIGEGFSPEVKSLLVQVWAVQDELALTPAQKSRLEEVRTEGKRAELVESQRFQDRFRALGPQPDPDASNALSRQFQQALNAVGRKIEAGMLEVLDRRQRRRLDQIHLQAEGPIAFSRREVMERLHLDPEQAKAIQTLIARGRRQVAETAIAPAVPTIRGPITPERGRALYESKPYQDAIRKNREITRHARKSTLDAITRLLRNDQHAEYLAMLGEPFDLTRLRGRKATP